MDFNVVEHWNSFSAAGAGIAGPTLAFWLDRAGHDVAVVERAPDLRLGGQAVDLRGAGRTVVERMDLMPGVRSVMLHQKGHVLGRRGGRARARMRVDAFDGEGFISEIEILRGDLAQLLFDATRSRVRYAFGDTITALAQHDGGVEVAFAHAAPRDSTSSSVPTDRVPSCAGSSSASRARRRWAA